MEGMIFEVPPLLDIQVLLKALDTRTTHHKKLAPESLLDSIRKCSCFFSHEVLESFVGSVVNLLREVAATLCLNFCTESLKLRWLWKEKLADAPRICLEHM